MQKTQFLLLPSVIALSISAAQAQPAAQDSPAQGSAGLSVRELEQLIGGRTTLEMKLKSANIDQLTEALQKSSGLPFSKPKVAQGRASRFGHGALDDKRLYDAEVSKADFWPALRAWSRSQNAKIAQEPQQNAGRLSLTSVRRDEASRSWQVSEGDSLATGRAAEAWPVMVLATSLYKSSSIRMSEAGDSPTPSDKSFAGAEKVEGGTMTENLHLSFLTYVEPKLMGKAKVQIEVAEALDDTGASLLAEPQKLQADGSALAPLKLDPKRAKGTKIAKLRGVAIVKVPMGERTHEVTDFGGSFKAPVASGGTQGEVEVGVPSLQGGRWIFETASSAQAAQGWAQMTKKGRADTSDLKQVFSPQADAFTYTDTQNRTWRVVSMGSSSSTYGASGAPVPQTSPPTPLPDDFSYSAQTYGILVPVDTSRPAYSAEEMRALQTSDVRQPVRYEARLRGRGGGYREHFVSPWPTLPLSPEEMAAVKFAKATFTTQGDWRTLEVPFELRDLPLPPR